MGRSTPIAIFLTLLMPLGGSAAAAPTRVTAQDVEPINLLTRLTRQRDAHLEVLMVFQAKPPCGALATA